MPRHATLDRNLDLRLMAEAELEELTDFGLPGLVLRNVRSLSGLSRCDEVVLWQDVLPGQFR
jgi:hypothetical protein